MKIDENKKLTKQRNKISLLASMAILILVMIGCETGPPKIGEVIVSNKKEAKENKLTFEPKDAIQITVDLENNLDDMKLKSYLELREDILDLKNGDVYPGTEGTDNFGSDVDKKLIEFSTPEGFPPGKYRVNLELQDKDGKKVDSKFIEIEVEGDKKSNDDDVESEEKSAYSPPVGNGGGD